MANTMEKNQGNKVRCPQCQQDFSNQQQLDDHKRQMHQNR